MSLLSRFTSVFEDHPATVNRGAVRFSGPMVAVSGVLLNVFILSLIFPFLIEPDDRDFRDITESLGFGGLFSLILLGGTLVIATVLIPFRLATVFMGPRIGRYFDQIVLSGISPFRLLIGNVAAQFYLIGLLLFLLLPHVVLAMTFGGFQPGIFVGCLLLVVVYCVMLSLSHLWLSLYVNEIIAALILIFIVVVCGVIGGIPAAPQPILVTPVPAILQPVYASIPQLANDRPFESFWPVFLGCCFGMSVVSCVAALAIHLGPLYGIVKSNSTFGEVVKPGDASKRKRFRFRLHIQRPSEITFLYQNRGTFLTRYEGVVRWGLGLGGLLLLTFLLEGLRGYMVVDMSSVGVLDPDTNVRRAFGFYAAGMVRHGITLVLAILLFSHPRNTTLQRVTVWGDKRATVSGLDWMSFLVFMLFSSAITIGLPWIMESSGWLQNGFDMFPVATSNDYWSRVSLTRMQIEGTLALSICGLTAYLIHRWFCQKLWMKVIAFFWTYVVALVLFCGLPLVPLLIIEEAFYAGGSGPLEHVGAAIAMISPPMTLMVICGEHSSRIPFDKFTVVFYLSQAVLLFLLVRVYRKGNRQLQSELLDESGAVVDGATLPKEAK